MLRPRIGPAIVSSDRRLQLQLSGASGQCVRVQRSANLVDWEDWRIVTLAGDAGIYRCPTDRSTVIDRSDLRRFRGYSLNGELNYWIIADAEYGLPILQAFQRRSR